jgi:hypothetical protein
MLDRQHAVAYRSLDRARCVGMRTHIEAGPCWLRPRRRESPPRNIDRR